jgi:hypothetical protein
MKIELLETAGFKAALESLRLPFKKECRSTITYYEHEEDPMFYVTKDKFISQEGYQLRVSSKDLALAQSLIKKGNDHAKFVRGIKVWLKVTAPRYWWSEHDTYTVGLTKLPSESTMHTLLKDNIGFNNFEEGTDIEVINNFIERLKDVKALLPDYPELIKVSKRALKQILPEGYLQTRIIEYSYQALRNIYFQRRNHDLPEWQQFCKFIETLPLAKELITIE